ncbi:MAG: FAD-dependent oxidoreductase [Armatimonadetes bacterium]|nr:FAD-dependent oxidoreductase [Armatimonadota bacterium]
MDYVVIGNSAAAVGAVESIRAVDKDGSITIISSEKEHVYSRPLIAHLLAGEVGEERMPYRPLDFYEKMAVKTRLGQKVKEVDFKTQKVILDGGGEVAYDRLLLTTGSKAVFPPIPGRELKGVTAFQTYAEAKAMMEMLQAGKKRAVVIGAGLIGMRAAYGLQKAGAEVTIIEFLPRVLSRVLDAEGSAMVESILKKGGLNVLTSRSVKEIKGAAGQVTGVALDNGEEIACDLVVLATGVAPDLALAGGLKTNHGIVVNQFFQTSYSNVFAAGDVAETYDIPRGAWRVNANWPNAHEQGRIAGLNMAGRPTPYQGSLGMNSVSFFGVPVVSLGVFDPEAESEGGYEVKVRKNPEANIYQKLVFKENRLKGAVFIGDLGYCGAVKDLIKTQMLAGIIKDSILEEKHQFYGFLRKKRQEKLEGKNIRWPETYSSQQKYVKSFNEETWTERERNERAW